MIQFRKMSTIYRSLIDSRLCEDTSQHNLFSLPILLYPTVSWLTLIHMKFTIARKKFIQALSFIPSIMERKTTLPVLSHCLIKAEKNTLTIMGTDLDIVISEQCQANIEKEGSYCVQGIVLHDIVKRLDTPDVSLSFEDQLFLRSGRSEFRLPTLSAEQFPDVSQSPLTQKFDLDPQKFKTLINAVRFCADEEQNNAILNSVFLHTLNDSGLYTAATNLSQFAVSRMDLSNSIDLGNGLLLGQKALNEIVRLLDNSVQSFTLGISNARIQCDIITEGLSIMFTSRLVDGLYPDYQHEMILPKHKVVMDRSILLHALERMMVIVDPKLKGIELNFTDKILTLSVSNIDSGSGKEELEISWKYDPLMIQFNIFNLIGILQGLSVDKIEIYVASATDAMHIKPVDSAYPHYLLMPLVD